MTSLADDRALIALAQTGDRAALDCLLRRHRIAIERICRRMCGADMDVDDVLQETYIAIVRNLPAFRNDSAFLTWVYTIVRTHRGRSARAARRDRGRMDALRQVTDVAPVEPMVEDAVESRELCAALGSAMNTIAALDRDVAFLRDVEGMSALEVAAQLGLTVAAVKSRLHRARHAIRLRLAPMVAA